MYFLLPVKGRGKGAGKKGDRHGTGQGTTGNGQGTGKKRTTGTDDAPGKKIKVTRDPIPEALRGMHSRTPDNKPICFNFNLGKCKAGAKCKFKHVCCKPGCYKAHAMVDHDSSSVE